MQFNGLPLHPLVVHLVVVLVPVSALVAILFVARPGWQVALRWPLAALGAATALLTWLAAASGDKLKELVNAGGSTAKLIETHEMWAGRLQAGAWVLGALAVLTAVQHAKGIGPAIVGTILKVLLAIAAVVIVFLAFKTGDAGAQATWSGYIK